MAAHGLSCNHWRLTPWQRVKEELTQVRVHFWLLLIVTGVVYAGAHL